MPKPEVKILVSVDVLESLINYILDDQWVSPEECEALRAEIAAARVAR